MPKFSIIIPAYNVEKYINKCLKSVFNQTFKDYEVIVVNDGSTDNTKKYIEPYDVLLINKKNSGLSSARNTGVSYAKGKYLIFLDSDDYIEKDLLKEINKSLFNNPDIVRYQAQEVYDNTNRKTPYPEKPFTNKKGVEAFNEIVKFHYVENAWLYAIKKDYYEKNNYAFSINKTHEDFGLIPLIIIKSNKVNSIDYIGYNYRQRENSIMSSNSYNKVLKKVEDFYYHYKYLINEIDKTNLNSKIFKSFIANSLILKITELNNNDYKKYKNKLIEDKVFDNLLDDTLPRKIKKILIKMSPKIYYKWR